MPAKAFSVVESTWCSSGLPWLLKAIQSGIHFVENELLCCWYSVLGSPQVAVWILGRTRRGLHFPRLAGQYLDDPAVLL